MKLLGSAIGRLRMIALLEGWSWLILLFVAMPLKYFAGNEISVPIVGRIHGGLFLIFCLALLIAMIESKWKLGFSTVVFLSSLVPFGAFFMDRELKRRQINEETPN